MEKVIEILREASHALDTNLGYSEHCYQTFLMTRMKQEQITVKKEVTCSFRYKNIKFGYGRIDLLVTTEKEVMKVPHKSVVCMHQADVMVRAMRAMVDNHMDLSQFRDFDWVLNRQILRLTGVYGLLS